MIKKWKEKNFVNIDQKSGSYSELKSEYVLSAEDHHRYLYVIYKM